MLTLPPSVRVFVATHPVGMRKGFDGLAGCVRESLQQEPMSGHLFVFLNKRGDKVKILLWDRTGWSLLYKRLEKGTYRLPGEPPAEGHGLEIQSSDLYMMLEGIDLQQAKRRPRWSCTAKLST